MTRGKLIVVSAPSGAGKTTIVKAILAKYSSLLFSVSATTRPIRPGEIDEKDYFFLSREEFERRIGIGQLVEWEEIYGNLYGTLRTEVDKALSAGKTMVFDIDVKGALSIKQQYAADSVLIFVRPPSFDVLRSRLSNRKTEDEAALARRLARVPMELKMEDRFDYCVVNDDLQTAVGEVEAIITKHVELVPL